MGKFAQIVTDSIWQHENDSFAFVVFPTHFLDELIYALEDEPWWVSHKQSFFLHQISASHKCKFILDSNPVVHNTAIEHFGKEFLPDSFRQSWRVTLIAVWWRCTVARDRIGADDQSFRASLFDFMPDACERASGAYPKNDRVYFSLSLIKDLLAQNIVMFWFSINKSSVPGGFD